MLHHALETADGCFVDEASALTNFCMGRDLVLLSGGLDSATLMVSLLDAGRRVEALHIDYGQPAATRELVAATGLARQYGIALDVLRVGGLSIAGGTEIAGRNSLLVVLALMHIGPESGVIYLGVHAGTSYVDCSPGFVDSQQLVLDQYSSGRVQLSTPFIRASKREIWDLAHELEISIGHTYSCELGRNQPCGECRSCLDIEALIAGH